MAKKFPILEAIAAGAILTAAGVALVKTCVNNYYDNLPGVVYLVDGKKVIERRFKTNAECQEYMDSEKGKQEAAYYLSLNTKRKETK
jgi:hypothetical protein